MSEPRYTIEQIELLRRLVRTGLSRDEIVHACDTMAKLDHELGPLPNKTDQPAVVVTAAASPPINSYHASQQLTVTSRNTVTGGDGMGQDPGSPTNRTSLVSLLSTMGHGGIGGYVENGDSRLNIEDFTVSNEEVEGLFRQGHMNVKEDIKDFLNKHGLSQNQISRSTGISQSYISQFLLHGYVMRRSTQAILYRWYLAKRKELEALDVLSAAGDQEPLPSPQEQRMPQRQRPLLPKTTTQRFSPYQTPSQAPPANMSFGGKRRERFVWKDNCLKVLEAYFKKNPYPNDMERIRLSDACNAMQQIPGTELAEHNKVNPSKVYNWFANRRKDANRKKRMAAENLITRNPSHDDGSLPDVDYLDDTSTDLTQDSDMTGALGENGNGDMIDHLDSESADQDQDPSEVANQLVEVNNSIMTLMKAVEERQEDSPIVKTESDT